MSILFLGIDPGVSGAVASIGCTPYGTFPAVWDLPVTTNTFLANQSKCLDVPAFVDRIADEILQNFDYVVFVTEIMQGMGFKTPARTLTMLAEMAGNIEATIRTICLTQNIPLFIRKYQPRIWTHWVFPNSGDRKDRKTEAKNESLDKARKLFPSLAEDLKLKKHHDRAEALLLAFTSLAELQGCVVEKKLKTFGALAEMYLTHSQSVKEKRAKFTDIFMRQLVKAGPIFDEIKGRK